jgi:hypothetical protein
MPETQTILNFTDADLKAALNSALRTCVALTIVSAGVWYFVAGIRSGALCLACGVVSIIGIYEWRQLISHVNARLDKQKSPHSTAWVATMFLLRFGFAALVVYVSLRCSHGRPYAILNGLGLAVLALTLEAVKLIRSW